VLVHNYFISDNIREELTRRAAAVRAVPAGAYALQGLPEELQGYHTIVPLDDPASLLPGPGQERRKFGGWLSSIYKAVSEKDGVTYALRRIESACHPYISIPQC
jgi:PAB-dependent poly(A)-specific ribonuclease subunit 3